MMMARTGKAANEAKRSAGRNPRKRRHIRLIMMLSILIVLTVFVEIYVSVMLFSKTTVDYRSEIITKAAKLASEQIDGNKIEGWLENGADADYQATAKRLQSILNNTPYLQYLYVYQIRPDGCYVVFDLETMAEELYKYDELPDVPTDGIGEHIDFDKSFSEYIPALLKGEVKPRSTGVKTGAAMFETKIYVPETNTEEVRKKVRETINEPVQQVYVSEEDKAASSDDIASAMSGVEDDAAEPQKSGFAIVDVSRLKMYVYLISIFIVLEVLGIALLLFL